MKVAVLIPTKGGYYREKSLRYTLRSYLSWPNHGYDLEILVVIDAKKCKNVERIEDIINEFNIQSSLKISSIKYHGRNPVWGGIKHLSRRTDYALIQGDDELAAKAKMKYLEKIIEEYGDSVLQLPVFERTSEPTYKPKDLIGQINEYGITSNFDAFPEKCSTPFRIYNLASNRVMPVDVASKYDLEEIRLWNDYGVETYLTFLLNRDNVEMYYVPKREVANFHLQAERIFWVGRLEEGSRFASKGDLERMILEVSVDHKSESDILRKSLYRLVNFTYIALISDETELVHKILKSFVK